MPWILGIARVIPVQIKGRGKTGGEKDKITFPVEVDDLENYYARGGTIYFVVYISPTQNDNETIFYATLLPFDIRLLLGNKNGQKTVSIELNRFPTDNIQGFNIISCFSQDFALQAQLSSIKDDDFKRICDLSSGEAKLSSTYTILSNNPIETILNLSGYEYRELDYGIKFPVGKFSELTDIERKIYAPVSCDGKTFFDSFRLRIRQDELEILIGTGISIVVNDKEKRTQIHFNRAGTLDQQLSDFECFQSIIKNQLVRLGDKNFCLPIGNANYDTLHYNERVHEQLVNLKQAFVAAGYTGPVNINDFSDEDWEKAGILTSAFVQNQSLFNRKTDGISFFCFTVGNVTLLLLIFQHGEDRRVLNPYTANLRVESEIDGEKASVSFFCFLEVEAFKTVSNFDFDAVMESISSVPFSSIYQNLLIQMLLNMLLAYDSGAKDANMLAYCEQLSLFLLKQLPEAVINKLNLYQVYRRERALTKDEISILHNLLEQQKIDDEQMSGIYILLGDEQNFKVHFKKMSPERRQNFVKYPIFHLLPDKTRNECIEKNTIV